MITKLALPTNLSRLALALTLALVLGACSGGQVRDESPLVRINELSHLDGTINLQLRIRNVNDEDLNIRRVVFELASDERELVAWDGTTGINIAAQGTETWSVDVAENEYGREMLGSLQRGAVMSLPYTLEGTVETAESRKLRFKSEGHIYTLPGKPGHFR